MFSKKPLASKRAEDIKKSAGKVVDPKRDTPTRAKHLRIFLDNAEVHEIISFYETYYSHIFYIVYDAFITAEVNLRQKGAHKAQREELESVLYLFEKVLIYLPEHLARKWQYHSVGRLMSKLLHPGNSWKLLKREAMRLFLLWYQILGEVAGESLHAMFATLVPGFPSPYQGLGLTALAAMTPDTQDGPINPAEICPLIPPQTGERWRSPDTDLTRIFLDVLLELMVSQVTLIEWKTNRIEKQKQCLNFLFEKFKTFYMMHIFPDFNWSMSIFRPSLELPEVRRFRPAFVDAGDGTKKMDPMLSCRVVVIKWVAQYTHITRQNAISTSTVNLSHSNVTSSSIDDEESEKKSEQMSMVFNSNEESTRNTLEGSLVREILYGSRENVNFVHEVYRQAFLLSFSHSPAIKKVISVYKDWIQMNVPELPPFLLEPSYVDKERQDFRNVMEGKLGVDDLDSKKGLQRDQSNVRAGLQNVLQIFITNAANVFLLEVSAEYPILLEEQVEMCKRVLNIYRYMVMNVKMEARTWEQLLFILLQITQLTLPETPPRRREDTLGGRLAQAIFQTLIVTWIKANLYVVVSTELWDQFLEVLSSLTLWEELIREWAKTMETLTRVLARQVYQLDLNDLPLDRLSERAAKKRRGKQGGQEIKYSSAIKPVLPDVSNPPVSMENGSCTGSIVGPASTDENSQLPRMRQRMNSESEAKVLAQRSQQKMHRNEAGFRRTLSDSNICGKLADIRREVTRMEEEFRVAERVRRKHRSFDSLWNYGSRYSGSEAPGSRSSSPAPSSGLECSSIKDSPMQFVDNDQLGEQDSNQSSSTQILMSPHFGNQTSTARSVMSGGTIKGWLPDVAVVLWRRMLGALGNINRINDTVIHAQIYKYLIDLFEIMVKIRDNQGVSLDNMITPKPPEFVPPFTIFAPWCFRALHLPEAYQRGRLYALRLLCLFTCRQHDAPLPKTHIVQFYKVLHDGLTGPNSDETFTLVKYTGPRFFSLMLPGYSAFVLDYLYATNQIISCPDVKGVPRTEATSIVGALLVFPPLMKEVPLIKPNSNELILISSEDLKDQIISVLLKSGKKEPAGLARCISLSSLGVFVYSELIQQSFHPKIKEAIQVLLTALRFNNKSVAQIAADMLLLLADHVRSFLDYYPEVPKKIVEVLCRTLVHLCPRGVATVDLSNSFSDDEKRLILSILTCLGEWCMRMPNFVLTQPQEDGRSILYHVFGALLLTGESKATTPTGVARHPEHRIRQAYTEVARTVLSPAVMVPDFDPNIHVDNMKEGYLSANSSPVKGKNSSDDLSSPSDNDRLTQQRRIPTTSVTTSETNTSGPIRLAAKTLLSHFVNHLFHFPMNDHSSLCSLVSENDDVFGLQSPDEMTSEVFQAPNIQFFIINNTTLLSFVELPSLETSFDTDDIKVAKSQVRIILRDVSGKFCWDSSALYGKNNSNNDDEALSKLWPSSYMKACNSIVSSPRNPMRRRHPSVLPVSANSSEDMDNLDDLLQYIGHHSPECLREPGRQLNSVQGQTLFDHKAEQEVITAVLNQRNIEQDAVQRKRIAPVPTNVSNSSEELNEDDNSLDLDQLVGFQQCRRLFNELGLASWEQRSNIHLVKKNDKLLREIKNLDSKRPRESHKIAVIYVGEGQEDKQSILSNASGSQAYEEFISGLAWEVELETHTGFMGGLQKSKTVGETSPYYATSFVEVMFHVATRMPSNSSEALLGKTRHIGNDEIHIVWSEHWREYRRGILPTEFCDVLIVIYPLKNKLFRIQVSRKPEVPYFGPLFNEMIVDQKVLPGLVRATAINASRAKRSMLTYYQNHYEERSRALENIIKNHLEPSTFEDFVTSVYSPRTLGNLFISSASSRPMSFSGTLSFGSQGQKQEEATTPTFSSSSRELKSFIKAGKAEIYQTLSTPVQLTDANNGLNIEDEISPRGGKKLIFKGSQSQFKRPVTIKEEPCLPQQTSPTSANPPRKR